MSPKQLKEQAVDNSDPRAGSTKENSSRELGAKRSKTTNHGAENGKGAGSIYKGRK